MNNLFNSKEAERAAETLLRIALRGRKAPVMRNVRAEHYIRPRGSAFAGHYYKVVEE